VGVYELEGKPFEKGVQRIEQTKEESLSNGGLPMAKIDETKKKKGGVR